MLEIISLYHFTIYASGIVFFALAFFGGFKCFGFENCNCYKINKSSDSDCESQDDFLLEIPNTNGQVAYTLKSSHELKPILKKTVSHNNFSNFSK